MCLMFALVFPIDISRQVPNNSQLPRTGNIDNIVDIHPLSQLIILVMVAWIQLGHGGIPKIGQSLNAQVLVNVAEVVFVEHQLLVGYLVVRVDVCLGVRQQMLLDEWLGYVADLGDDGGQLLLFEQGFEVGQHLGDDSGIVVGETQADLFDPEVYPIDPPTIQHKLPPLGNGINVGEHIDVIEQIIVGTVDALVVVHYSLQFCAQVETRVGLVELDGGLGVGCQPIVPNHQSYTYTYMSMCYYLIVLYLNYVCTSSHRHNTHNTLSVLLIDIDVRQQIMN